MRLNTDLWDFFSQRRCAYVLTEITKVSSIAALYVLRP
jgi:hypothetical protein